MNFVDKRSVYKSVLSRNWFVQTICREFTKFFGNFSYLLPNYCFDQFSIKCKFVQCFVIIVPKLDKN